MSQIQKELTPSDLAYYKYYYTKVRVFGEEALTDALASLAKLMYDLKVPKNKSKLSDFKVKYELTGTSKKGEGNRKQTTKQLKAANAFEANMGIARTMPGKPIPMNKDGCT